ncbi:MAG TPA: hypothetical protein VGC36_18225 [Rhizomicrobium sp.]
MKLKTLIRLWLWTVLLAVAAFAVLAVLEQKLKAATGAGVLDLQGAASAMDYKRILAAWIARPHAAAAGFSLGFDYLFMPLYAFAFYFSAMLAREGFTPKRGVARRTVDYLGFVPFIGMFADGIENGLEYAMLTGGADDGTARLASMATSVKWTCFTVGLLLLLAAIAGVVKLRLPKKEEA